MIHQTRGRVFHPSGDEKARRSQLPFFVLRTSRCLEIGRNTLSSLITPKWYSSLLSNISSVKIVLCLLERFSIECRK